MPNDADGWDHYFGLIEAAKAAPEQKDCLAEAVRTLRRALGEDWPSELKDRYHPILWSLRSISGAAFDNLLVLWGGCVSALEDAEGFEGMLTKMRRPEGSESSVAELEVAGRLASSGYTVELEPEVGGRKPDMRCRRGSLEFLVEVKTLATATETRKAIRTFSGIVAACHPVLPVGVIFKTLSKPHLKEVTDRLAREASRAISGRMPVEVHLNKVLKAYLVPDELPGAAGMRAEWLRGQEAVGAVPRGSGWISGPPDNVREEYRARIRIDQFSKRRQIPPEELGVLVLTGNFFFWDAYAAERFVDHIIEGVYELENVQAVALVSHKAVGDTRETEIVDRTDFVYVRNHVYDYVGEDIVVVKNRFCKSGLDYGHLASLLAITR